MFFCGRSKIVFIHPPERLRNIAALGDGVIWGSASSITACVPFTLFMTLGIMQMRTNVINDWKNGSRGLMMFNTGLKKYETTDINNFTSASGILIRRKINRIWRKILSLGTHRKVYIEQYPSLNKDEVYLFAANHSFDEDAISILQSIDRNAYMLQGTTHQMEHNPIFYAMWANGMVYVNRLDDKSRKESLDKMKRILMEGSSVVLFPEGGYNNTENQLITPLFSSPYILNRDLGVKVVPIISFNEIGSDEIFVRAGSPMNLAYYEKQEALDLLRDAMATLLYEIMEDHTIFMKRKALEGDPRKEYLEVRKNVYACQKWYADVWDEELTYYPGHNVTTPKQSREYIDNVQINSRNAYIFADTLMRRMEDLKYDLVGYMRENLRLSN